ncbi:MAG: tetratricopeptide repeat protein [Gemmatimonadota bacterium]|nr:tetratricopeptide repeat protein [Gemmatimonadota bacterium]
MAKRNSLKRKAPAVTAVRADVRHTWAWPVLVGIAAFVVYGNALTNGLVYDDQFLIVRSWLVERLDFGSVFTTHYWAGYPGNETGQYRPLTVLTFLLDALGGIHPFRYHLTNVLLHVGCSLLAWMLCRRVGLGRFAAGFAGLLFAVHPIHSEVAAGVTFGRSDLLAGAFLLAGMLLYIRSSRFRAAYVFALIVFFCGLLSKESALALMGMVVVYDFAIGMGSVRGGKPSGEDGAKRRPAPGVSAQPTEDTRWRAVFNGILHVVRTRWPWWLGFAGVFAICLVVRNAAAGLGFTPGGMSELVNPLYGASYETRVLTAGRIFWHYMTLLILPWRLSVDYSYNAIPVAASLLEPDVVAGLVLGLAGMWLWVRSLGKWPRLFFCGALFWVPYLGVSQTVVLLNSMVQERFLYIPALGVFAIAGIGAERLFRRFGFGIIIAACLVCIGYAARTVVRNRDWRDEFSLFSSAASAYPASAKMHQAVGQVIAERGLMDRAVLAFQRALSIREEAMTYNNLGNAYGVKGSLEHAVAAYRKAVDLNPQFAEAWMNLGVTAMRAGEPSVAVEGFRRASVLLPEETETHFNLGVALEKTGKPHEAAKAYRRSAALGDAKANFNLGAVLQAQGKSVDAVAAYEAFLKQWRGDPKVSSEARRRIRMLAE